MPTKTIKMRVNSHEALIQATKEVPVLGVGLTMISNGLVEIAERAIELNDSKLLWELYHLGCVSLNENDLAKIEEEIKA